jgi:polysaccharide export outer membrane protein
MTIFRTISSAIFSLLIFNATISFAQDRFDVDDMSAHAGYRGYTTYRSGDNAGQRDDEPMSNREREVISEHYRDDRAEDDMRNPSRFSDQKKQASRLEEFYRERADIEELVQFGYDLFYQADQSKSSYDNFVRPSGAVQDDYTVQSGDELFVIFSGERKDRKKYIVGSDGRLLIEGFEPVVAMGRPLGDVKREINLIAKDAFYRGGIDVSVSGVRQIGVLVAGHVHRPGRHQLNTFHSVLDAISMAGGVRKNGTLRNIKLIRNGSSQYIDLYKFYGFEDRLKNNMLRDGDRVIVSPVGSTFSVVGDVRAQGIFELLSGKKRINLREALDLSGGLIGDGDLTRNSPALISNGSILKVMRSKDRLQNAVELKGYSLRNGLYEISLAGTLSHLIGGSGVVADDTYPLIGVISRVSNDGFGRQLMSFSPRSIVNSSDDRQLESGDIVYLFSREEIKEIINLKSEKENKNNGKNEFSKQIIEFILSRTVNINGAVFAENKWPVGATVDLKTLVSVAGGFLPTANKNDIEIVTYADDGKKRERRKISKIKTDLSQIILQPGDQVRVNEKFDTAVVKTVRVSGEVKNPGSYDLMRGDKLSSLINRAGGLTDDAYAPAAVFSRKAERKREGQKFRTAAQELERTVSVNLNATDKNASLTPAQISMARKLADDLRAVKAIGRVTVEADPTVLLMRPEVDMLLEDGDHLHFPKRTLSVRVSGEVMNPVSLLFTEDKDVSDYIDEAGGKTYYADSGRMFAVYPDGSAQPVGGGHDKIIPGSTIIVPRDPKPFNFMDSFKDITQILTNMAITGVFIEDIATDEN